MKKISLVIVLSLIAYLSGFAQNSSAGYKMQYAPLQTRWAKQVTPANNHNLYPRPQMTRKNWQNLNGLWQYTITPKDADKPTAFEGQILVPYPLESALSGVKKSLQPDQNLWYKRTFTKPILKNGERLLLHFGAVDWQATVFVNGKEVSEHKGGYTAFSFDVTDYLKNGNNELLVKVFDPTNQGYQPHGKQVLNPANIYYTPTSGIWQTVWMETVPKDHIENVAITPDIDNSEVSVTVHSKAAGKVKLTVNGVTVSGNSNEPIKLRVKNPHLWSPDDPYLHDLSVKLGSDEVNSYFGMRKIEIKKDEQGFDRIFLNNKYTYNLGVLDQGFWPDGLYTAPTDEALAFDIKAIKAMGFNTIRKHIKIEPARWYYYADKLGMLVWQDFVNPVTTLPDGAKKAFELHIKEVMDQLHNHPSIITWVLFNERWGAYDQARLATWVKDYDPSRLLNAHSGELLYVNDRLRAPSKEPYIGSDMTDVHSYPDPRNAIQIPGKVKVLGEFGGVGVSVPYHQWNDLKGWGYIQASPTELQGKYEIMTKRLQKLEKEGLSASIYTQPFDVEGEENGLLSYDREIIKIPLTELRRINQKMISATKDYTRDHGFFLAKDIDVNDTDERYGEFLASFKNGQRDSAFLRRLVLVSIRKNDKSNTNKVAAAYFKQLKNVYSKQNLSFLAYITRSSNDSSFTFFRENSSTINKVLGNNAAENVIKKIIKREDIDPYTTDKNDKPDWESIQKRIIDKYGAFGEEYVYGQIMAYYWTIQDWNNMSKYYKLYYELALTRSDWNINSASWKIFLYINDLDILKFATKVAKYNIENFDKSFEALDTYANLLYKTGNISEALHWEKIAVEMSGNDKVYVETLEKMKRGEKTWP